MAIAEKEVNKRYTDFGDDGKQELIYLDATCSEAEYVRDLTLQIREYSPNKVYQILVDIEWNKKVVARVGELRYSHIISSYGPGDVKFYAVDQTAQQFLSATDFSGDHEGIVESDPTASMKTYQKIHYISHKLYEINTFKYRIYQVHNRTDRTFTGKLKFDTYRGIELINPDTEVAQVHV